MLVILYKRDAHGKLKYYVLDDRQPGLFSPYTLHVGWGNSPDVSARKHYAFDDLESKNKKIRTVLKRKIGDYQILYSYFKDAGEKLRIGAISNELHPKARA